MKLSYLEQIERINKIDTDETGLLLITAIKESFLISNIIKNNSKSSLLSQNTINLLLDEFRDRSHYSFFEKKLALFLGLKLNDEIANDLGDIIFQHFTNQEINFCQFKQELISLIENYHNENLI